MIAAIGSALGESAVVVAVCVVSVAAGWVRQERARR